MTIWTIYCHTHIESGRRYVGLTRLSMMKRWNRHVYAAVHSLKGTGTSHFANAIRKYGKDAFSHEVLETCATIEEANAAEERWIAHFDTRNPEKGFNLAPGGCHTPHPVRNPWDRPEFRAANAGRNVTALMTPEARKAQLESMRSPESRAKRSAMTKESQARPEVKARQRELHDDPAYLGRISESTKAALSSPKTRARLSESSKALHADPAYKEKVISAVTEASRRPEVRAKLSASSKATWTDPDYVAKQRAKVASPETRAKIGASSKGRRHTPESVEEQRRLYLERSSRCKFCDCPVDGKRTCIRGRVACRGCKKLHDDGLASFVRPDGGFVRP